ncbi:MAG: glycoside hydrolase family 31 protein [Planctomycetota bacterium]
MTGGTCWTIRRTSCWTASPSRGRRRGRRDYPAALADLVAVGEPIPLPPRFAFGSWYSRYWPYTGEDFLAIADGYRQRGYPLDVMVIDIDWHLDGWTGYTWNRKLIPNPEALLGGLHDRGLHVTLNLHPHQGVRAHEAAYPEFARAMGVDPESKQPIPFDIADPRYVENYFTLLHHPLEKQGVDFWWVDWQQERTTKIPGLDPLPWLNHLHFHDRGREGTGRRCMSFSRWGGWGDHRHPIQFSGDTESTWRVLEFLVPFTATAGNVGAAYWSHDLGGHWSSKGQISPELYARWLQFGAFTAAMRVHSTRDPQNDRRPWIYGAEFEKAAHAAYDLRYRLLPYIYTMARKTYETGLPLCRPMYVHHPDQAKAYEVPGQFYFGDDIIVAPAVEPGRGRAKMADVVVWLPEGKWYDLLTNVRYEGPTETLIKVPLDRIPVFVRGGRPIPMQPSGKLNTKDPIDPLVVRVYPGPAGETILYEDDGESPDYKKPGGFAKTRITYAADEETGAFEVVIHPVEGTHKGMPKTRSVIVEACAVPAPASVTVDEQVAAEDGGPDDAPSWSHYAETMVATVRSARRKVDQPTRVRFAAPRVLPERWSTEGQMAELRVIIADYRAQGGVRSFDDIETEELSKVASKETRDFAEMTEAFYHDVVKHETSRDSDDGRPALEALLGASLRTSAEAVRTDRMGVAGSLWLSRLPARRPVSGTVDLTMPNEPGSALPAQQRIVFERPGRQSFVFDLPVNPRRLRTLRGQVTARLNWADVPVSFSRDFEWDNSFISRWWVVGPFDGGKGPRAQSLEPETDPALDRQYVANTGQTVGWRAIDVRKDAVDPGVVDLERIYGGQNVTAFGQAFLESEADAEVELVIRHDDGVIVWVNGQEAYAFEEPRALGADPVPFPVKLNKGRNTVMVKVDQLGGGWGFSIRVVARKGRAFPPVRVVQRP